MQDTSGMTTIHLTPLSETAPPLPVQVQPEKPRFKGTLRGLGITELLLGCLCILVGSLLVGLRGVAFRGNPTTGFHNRSFYEGIWGGAFIVVAGGTGIAAGGKNTNRSLVNTHMVFSILGAMASVAMLLCSVIISLFNLNSFNVAFYVTIDVSAGVSLILLVLSASFCCCSLRSCCCCADDSSVHQAQVANLPYQETQVQQYGSTGMSETKKQIHSDEPPAYTP